MLSNELYFSRTWTCVLEWFTLSLLGNNPAYTRRWPNVGLILDRRRRRRANIKPTLGQRFVFAVKGYVYVLVLVDAVNNEKRLLRH